MNTVAGFTFPFHINAAGGVGRTQGPEKIRQNIRNVLGTRHGERPMLRGYGTRVHSLVHEPNSEVLAVLVRKQVQESLLTWEPRIVVTDLAVERHEGELHLRLDFTQTDEPVSDSLLVPLA